MKPNWQKLASLAHEICTLWFQFFGAVFASKGYPFKNIFDILYVASSGGPLPSLFKLCPWGQKWPRSGGHIFYVGLYSEKHEKIFLSETIWPKVLIFGM